MTIPPLRPVPRLQTGAGSDPARPAWRGPDTKSDTGAATVLAAVSALALIAVTALGLQLSAAAVARHRVQIAADLGALAGAAEILRGADAACAAAEQLVAENGAELASCATQGADVLVITRVQVHLALLAASATGRARAGQQSHQTG